MTSLAFLLGATLSLALYGYGYYTPVRKCAMGAWSDTSAQVRTCARCQRKEWRRSK